MKLKGKLLTIAASSLVFVIITTEIAGFLLITNLNQKSTSTLKTNMLAGYDQAIKEQIENAISVMNTFYMSYQNSEISLSQAKIQAAKVLREVTFGESGYFWVDESDGDNVFIKGSSTEGTNRLNIKDKRGTYLV